MIDAFVLSKRRHMNSGVRESLYCKKWLMGVEAQTSALIGLVLEEDVRNRLQFPKIYPCMKQFISCFFSINWLINNVFV